MRLPSSRSSTTPVKSSKSAWSSKNAHASCVIGSSSRPSDDHALPCSECECAAAITSGRAACTCEWIANAARVHHRVALDDRAGVVDADQVGDADVLEVHPERVDPEPVEVLGIAHGDVAGDAFVEAELAEQAERRREPLLAVQPLLLDGVELGKEGQVGKQGSHG